MHKVVLSCVLSVFLPVSAAHASYSSSIDSDGCWDARTADGGRCLRDGPAKWSDGKMTVRYDNVCGYRIYAGVCQKQESGSWDCGNFGISANSSSNYYTYDATGRIRFNSVGSVRGRADWTCALRYDMKVRTD